MKVLLYCGYRVGSKSLGEWLSFELNLKYYHEPFNILHTAKYAVFKDMSIKDDFKDCVIKISPRDSFNYYNDYNLFDKRIILYRENTREQAESNIWGKIHMSWYQNYTIDEQFLITHKKDIDDLYEYFEEEKNYLKKLQNCLIVSYEEVFYSDIGIKKIEEYLGIKSKSKFDPNNKLRNGSENKKII